MKIKRLEIKGLFGRFNYEFEFENNASNLFMFHGYNGAGKTKVLSIINQLARRDFTNLETLNCTWVKLTYSDDRSVVIEKSAADSSATNQTTAFDQERLEKPVFNVYLEENNKKQNLLRIKKSSKQTIRFSHNTRLSMNSSITHGLATIEELIPHLRRIDRDAWYDERTNSTMPLLQVLHAYSEWLPQSYVEQLANRYDFGIYQIDKLPHIKTRFINTRRLDYAARPTQSHRMHHEEEEARNPLNDLSQKISEMLALSSSKYAAKSQQLDSLFPRAILDTLSPGPSPAEVSSLLKNLKSKAEALHHAGILEQPDTIDLETSPLDPMLLAILARYCEDTEKKLAEFEDIYERINLLTKIINKRFRFKHIKISKSGIMVYDETKNVILPLESLSSGEQHELFLFADLIFSDDKSDLIFIDEPEISLHVEWQESFVDDLLRINSLQDSQIFIATHSPSIIGHHWDKSFDLTQQSTQHD